MVTILPLTETRFQNAKIKHMLLHIASMATLSSVDDSKSQTQDKIMTLSRLIKLSEPQSGTFLY